MADTPITLRLTIDDPLPGIHYSLQDPRNAPIGPVVATAAPLSFDVPVRLTDDGRFLGPFVRREGPTRRFVYIAIAGGCWNRRAKIDVHDIPPDLLAEARTGRVLEIRLPGRGRDGSPTCATVRSARGWQPV